MRKKSSYLKKYGPGSRWNLPVEEVLKWYKQMQREAAYASAIARFKKRHGIWFPNPIGSAIFSEQAVLTVVAGEVRKHGVCSLCIDALAALAGTCRTVVKDALHKARARRLLMVEERRRRGQASLTNIIRIISGEWLAWLRLANTEKTGFKKMSTAGNRSYEGNLRAVQNSGRTRQEERVQHHRSGWGSRALFAALFLGSRLPDANCDRDGRESAQV
jgi:hypothetical protein